MEEMELKIGMIPLTLKYLAALQIWQGLALYDRQTYYIYNITLLYIISHFQDHMNKTANEKQEN